MTNRIDCVPVRTSKKGLITALVLMLITPLCVYCSNLPFLLYPGLMQAIGLASLAAGVYVALRWTLTDYEYSICDREPEDGTVKSDFIVTRRVGRRTDEVLRLSFDTYRACIPQRGKWKKEMAARGESPERRVNAAVNLRSPDACCALFLLNGVRIGVTFEPDSVFLDEMERRRPQDDARDTESESEESK